MTQWVISELTPVETCPLHKSLGRSKEEENMGSLTEACGCAGCWEHQSPQLHASRSRNGKTAFTFNKPMNELRTWSRASRGRGKLFPLRSRGTRLGLIIFQSTLSLYWCISNYIYLIRQTMPIRPLHISRYNESYLKQTQSCVFNWLNGIGCLEPNSCFLNVLTSLYLLRICMTVVWIQPIQCSWELNEVEEGRGIFRGLRVCSLFISFSRCSSHHFWEAKARFLHQRTQQSDWHIYGFSLQLF